MLIGPLGYQTAFIGKWGIGDSPERTHQGAAVFDYWAGQPEYYAFNSYTEEKAKEKLD